MQRCLVDLHKEMDPVRQKSKTLPPGVSPPKASANVGLFRRLKRRFLLKNKAYDLGIPENESIQGVSFRRRSDDIAGKEEKGVEISRTQSERLAQKPIITVLNQSHNKKSKSKAPVVNGNGIYEFDKSLNRSFEEDCVIVNNFVVSDDQAIDLDNPQLSFQEKEEIFIDPDPGYETLDEVRRKMKLQMSESMVVKNNINDNFERDTTVRTSQHRRTQSSGTAENCIRSDNYDPIRDIYTRKMDNNSPSACASDINLSQAPAVLQRPYTICGNSPNMLSLGSCPLRNDQISLPNIDNSAIQDGMCNSDTCLCQYSATGELYANPKILFRKRSQKQEGSNSLSLSDTQNIIEPPDQFNMTVDNRLSSFDEGPPLPARKYSMYDDLKSPDSASFLASPGSKTDSPIKHHIEESSINSVFNSEHNIDMNDQTGCDTKQHYTESYLLNYRKSLEKQEESCAECYNQQNSAIILEQPSQMNELKIHKSTDFAKCENIDSVKSDINCDVSSNISDTCGSLSVSVSSGDTIKCVVLDSPQSTEAESIPEELEILHISEEDEGYAEVKDAEFIKKQECLCAMNDREVQLGWISEGLENVSCSAKDFSQDGNSEERLAILSRKSLCDCSSDHSTSKKINRSSEPWTFNLTTQNSNTGVANVPKMSSKSQSLPLTSSNGPYHSDMKLDINSSENNYRERDELSKPIIPTPESSQTQYFSDSKIEFRSFGQHHRKSSTLESMSSFAESDDNSSIRSSEILSDIHVMSYEDDADAILESLASRRSSFADELDTDTYGNNEASGGQCLEGQSSQSNGREMKRLPDFYYDDSEPIHMSLAELGMDSSESVRNAYETLPDDHDERTPESAPTPPLKQRSNDLDTRPPAIIPRSNKETGQYSLNTQKTHSIHEHVCCKKG